jgi:tyrosine decarboxylase/aspartate 1-decarboxylase
MHWPKLSSQQIKERIFKALANNLNYRSEKILGIPATYLDSEIFYEDAPFLKNAPFLSVFIANPNHIGCHTLPGEKEPMFKGTQEIERDLIRICAEEIFGAEKDGYDGYVASGGTEANLEALWIYRNYFERQRGASAGEIALIYSSDTHYSFHKAADILSLETGIIRVDENSREMVMEDFDRQVASLKSKGKKYFIINVNLSTTMFGSVDDIRAITNSLKQMNVEYKLHLDAAFGGFVHPFSSGDESFSFLNPDVSSVTIDGHKMLQTPYGTGIFLVRKGLIGNVCTREASYVQGMDHTICGSRSGANAAAVWMILHVHGSSGWKNKIEKLLDKTSSLCSALDELGVKYFRNPFMNIVAIRREFVSQEIAAEFCLIPDDHHNPSWYKVVIMPHVKMGVLDELIAGLTALRKSTMRIPQSRSH